MLTTDGIASLGAHLDVVEQRLDELSLVRIGLGEVASPTPDAAALEVRRAAEVIGRARAYVLVARRSLDDAAAELRSSPGGAGHDLGLFVRQVGMVDEFAGEAARHLAAMRRALGADVSNASQRLRAIAADDWHKVESVRSTVRVAARLADDLAGDGSRVSEEGTRLGRDHERRQHHRPVAADAAGPRR